MTAISNIDNLNEEIQNLINANPNKEQVELVEDILGNTMIDFFEEGKNDIDTFNEFAWNTGEGYVLPNYPHVSSNLEGLTAGLYLFAGASNHGKSAIMMNMMHDACMHADNNLFGIYFSLDDSKNEIIPRIVAMDQRIPISAVSKPSRYKNFIEAVEANGTQEMDMGTVLEYEEYLMKRDEGLENLKNNSNRLKIEDSTRCTNLADIEDYIQKAIAYVKSIDENMNIMIALDSINDIGLPPGMKSNSNNDKLEIVSKTVKNWAVKYDIPIFASTHLRKLNGNRRPTLDDLKESNTLLYEASVVWLVYNDVSANKQGAKIYATDSTGDTILKTPIIELDWGKNKKSSYKGLSFNYFSPEHSKAIECGEDVIRRFNALIFES